MPWVRQELSRGDPELLAGGPAAKPAPYARAVREIADGARREAAIRAQVPRLPGAARQGEEVLRMGVDERAVGRVAANEEGAELDELRAHAVARSRD